MDSRISWKKMNSEFMEMNYTINTQCFETLLKRSLRRMYRPTTNVYNFFKESQRSKFAENCKICFVCSCKQCCGQTCILNNEKTCGQMSKIDCKLKQWKVDWTSRCRARSLISLSPTKSVFWRQLLVTRNIHLEDFNSSSNINSNNNIKGNIIIQLLSI
jgi:hypothetical protein